MALNSWLTSLKLAVSDVSAVQPNIHAGYSRYGTETADVSDVSARDVAMRTDTADTAEKIQAYQLKPASVLTCTPDTADTSKKIVTGAGFAANDPAPDPDRHCYPHTEAANSAEMSAMATRLATFARIGLPVDEAEKLADRLMQRDRDPQDDRRICLECAHCQYGRCGNSRTAGLRYPEFGTDYSTTLKQCSGFAPGQGTLTGTSLAFSSLPPSKPLPRPHQGHPLTPQQQVAARDYHTHHFMCPTCVSAGQGRGERCQRGAELWSAYTGDGDAR